MDSSHPSLLLFHPGLGIEGKNALTLNKTLYGLKIAYSAGLQAVRDSLVEAGLQPLSSEPSLLVAHEAGLEIEADNSAIAMTYSRGVVVAGPNGYGHEVLESLQGAGLTASQGPNDLIFGLTVRPQRGNGRSRPNSMRLAVSQPQYIDRVVQRFGKVFTSSSPTAPMPTRELPSELRAFAGCLNWLASTTHPLWSLNASDLTSDARPGLSTGEWGNAWDRACILLGNLEDSKERNLQLLMGATLTNAPHF